MKVARHLAPDSLHSVVDGLGVLAEALCDVLIGKPVEKEVQHPDLKLGQVITKRVVKFFLALSG